MQRGTATALDEPRRFHMAIGIMASRINPICPHIIAAAVPADQMEPSMCHGGFSYPINSAIKLTMFARKITPAIAQQAATKRRINFWRLVNAPNHWD